MQSQNPEAVPARGLEAKLAAAAVQPGDVGAQITAAYACQGAGRPEDAVEYYQAALTLDLPLEGRRTFLTGYATALLAVDRAAQAAAVLQEAVAAYPEDLVLRVLEALVLHEEGRRSEAFEVLLSLLLRRPELRQELGRYGPALEGLRDELRAELRGARAA